MPATPASSHLAVAAADDCGRSALEGRDEHPGIAREYRPPGDLGAHVLELLTGVVAEHLQDEPVALAQGGRANLSLERQGRGGRSGSRAVPAEGAFGRSAVRRLREQGNAGRGEAVAPLRRPAPPFLQGLSRA
jgi:hypothetical protein